jgi:uncharacterized protein (TIGR02453 family)
VRFSKDKTPYKTQAALHFRHEVGKDVHGPGYYLHLEPGSVKAAAGMWHPDAPTLAKVRDAIVASPDRWRRIMSGKGFSANNRLEGESLKRPPKGYDPNHPLIEYLKLKDFIVTRSLTEEDAYSPDFMRRFAGACSESAPFMEFLTTAVGLPW